MKIIILANTRNKSRSISFNPLITLAGCCAIIFSLSTGIFFSGIQYAKYNSAQILKSIRTQTYSGWEQKLISQEAELNELIAALVRRQQIAAILNATDFGNTAGYSAYFTAFAKQIPANVWITGIRIEGAGHDMQVQGRTLQAELLPTFVTQLKREKIMQGKTFAALQMERPKLEEKTDAAAGKKARGDELAPYLEFALHSMEAKATPLAGGGKTP